MRDLILQQSASYTSQAGTQATCPVCGNQSMDHNGSCHSGVCYFFND